MLRSRSCRTPSPRLRPPRSVNPRAGVAEGPRPPERAGAARATPRSSLPAGPAAAAARRRLHPFPRARAAADTDVTHTMRTCIDARTEEVVVLACGAFTPHPHEDRRLWDGLTAAGHLTLDLSLVTNLDAAGVGLLASAAERAMAGGASVSVRAASEIAHRLARLARLDTVVPGAWHERSTDAAVCSEPCAG